MSYCPHATSMIFRTVLDTEDIFKNSLISITRVDLNLGSAACTEKANLPHRISPLFFPHPTYFSSFLSLYGRKGRWSKVWR